VIFRHKTPLKFAGPQSKASAITGTGIGAFVEAATAG
jgi:hypothetical protein